MKKIWNYFTTFEKLLWLSSVSLIIFFFIYFKNTAYLYLAASILGATSLIFLAKASPIGQVLVIIFSTIYGYISLTYQYYGEFITYCCMTLPIAVVSTISWFKHPHKEDSLEVQIDEIDKQQYLIGFALSVVVTIIFYFILKFLGTSNLLISTVSIFTSFYAAYITYKRSRFYALFYSVNDIVLIVLWGLACREDINYLSMVLCFVVFFVNDIYGFINWTKLMKNQKDTVKNNK